MSSSRAVIRFPPLSGPSPLAQLCAITIDAVAITYVGPCSQTFISVSAEFWPLGATVGQCSLSLWTV